MALAGLGYKDFVNGTIADSSEADGYFMRQAVMHFADIAARDAALGGVAGNALLAYTEADDMLWMKRGGVWKELLPRTFVHTGADLQTNTSGTFTNMTGFTFPAKAGGVYAIRADLFVINLGSSSPDIRFGWSWTGTGTMTAGQAGTDVNLAGAAYNGPWSAHAMAPDSASPADEATGIGLTAGIPLHCFVIGTFEATDDQTVQMRFAQATADATWVSRVQRGSRLEARRVN